MFTWPTIGSQLLQVFEDLLINFVVYLAMIKGLNAELTLHLMNHFYLMRVFIVWPFICFVFFQLIVCLKPIIHKVIDKLIIQTLNAALN